MVGVFGGLFLFFSEKEEKTLLVNLVSQSRNRR